jgi:hypothetical protein
MCSNYTVDELEDRIVEWGEVWVVLDSGKEYQLHGKASMSVMARDESPLVRVEGLREPGEYLEVEFPMDAVESLYTHREV